MADVLGALIRASVSWVQEEDPGKGTIIDASELLSEVEYSDGTGSTEADIVWRVAGSLGVSSTVEYDLQALPLGLFDDTLTLTMETVRAIIVICLTDALNARIAFGPSASDPFDAPFNGTSGDLGIERKGVILATAPLVGWDCSSGNSKFRLANSSTAVDYCVGVVGTTA